MSGKEFKKTRKLTDFAFKTSKKNLQDLYDDTEYGWDDIERKEEMCDECVRFLRLRFRRCREGKTSGILAVPRYDAGF